jgi:hypothetical protein
VLFLCALGAAADSGAATAPRTAVLPASPPGLVYVEGEDAVSTSMATEPTLNYGCSSKRALQLSRSGQLPGGAAFYAEYGFYVDSDGRYELWYGGTPPGSRDALAISFASPFSVSVDGGEPRALFREDVNVVERYAPSYYWVRTPALDLARGAHVIRFEVSTKRHLDDHFLFYLDAFFVASPEALAAAKTDRAGFPDLFPRNPDDRRIDFPFQSIEDYQARIQAKPSEILPYMELADEYSLSGDYLNALKTLSKAIIVAPQNPDLRLLTAKNRIWRGDIKEGIEAYGVYISLRPDDLGAYEEAGKIAAWSGRFSDSDYFYSTGLAAFPGNSSLTVNRGLSLLWASRVADAERDFAEAERAALGDPALAAGLAAIYRVNGFPDRAVAVYEKAIAAFPDHLGLYLDELAILAATGKAKAERELEARIAATFESSPELDAVLATARARRALKADRIAELEARIVADPDDLGLRDELTRVYAWNGRAKEAARQLESILAARFALALADADAALADVCAAQFSAAALRADADARLAALAGLRAKAQAAGAAADKAMADLRARGKTLATAQAAGKGVATADSARRAAFAAARLALDSLDAAVSGLAAEDARASLLADRAASAKATLDAELARDEADEAAFKALAAGQGWTFDAAAAAAEMAVAAAHGEQIAALMRTRILMTAKDPKAALAPLAAVTSEALASGRRHAELLMLARFDQKGLYKAALAAGASGDGQSAALDAAAAELAAISVAASATAASATAASATAASATAASATAASATTSEAGGVAEAPAEDTETETFEPWAGALGEALAAGLAEDTQARKAAADARVTLAAVVQGATALGDRRLGRAWHSFESGAPDLRSELGAYYDSTGQAEAATRQYRRVLALDPANIRAMHSLALAEEKSGDWAAAAGHFKAVNAADPYYLNAASRHNAIERTHAQSMDLATTFLADSNLMDYRSDLNAVLPLGSFLSLRPSVDVRSIRDHSLGYPAFVGVTLGLEVPVTLVSGPGGRSLVLRPSGELAATSADFSASGAATVSPAQFLGALSLFSAVGMGLDWSSGQWSGSASYSWAPLPASLNPAMSALYAHRLELSGGAYLPLGGAFRYLASRVYASGGYVPGDLDNLYGTVLAEVIPAFRLSDSPWANLGLPLDLVYEDSKTSRSSPYFAAAQVLTAKGGLLLQGSRTLKGGDSLSLSLEAMGGLYMQRTFSEAPASYPYLYAFTRLDWAHAGATWSLSLEASATDPFSASPQYWSFSLMGGVSARHPSLIAP